MAQRLYHLEIAGQTVAMKNSLGLQFLLTDHLGLVVATTNDIGTLTSEQRYLPFGGIRTDVGNITQTDLSFTGQRSLNMGLMDYKARFYSSALGRFIQPDSIIPNPSNPQSWNRFSYVLNGPIGHNDPTGHSVDCGLGESGCKNKPTYMQPGGGNNKKGDAIGNLKDDSKTKGCSYHLCSDTNLYELGWKNFGSAWSIYTNPSASYSQRYIAGAYMGYWSGAHAGFVIGATALTWEAIVPGSVSCVMNAECEEEVARQVDHIGGVRILLGDEDLIAVIGRNQAGRVVPFADAIGARTWTGFNELLSTSKNVANNRAWADELKALNYTVYDIGLDPKYTAVGNFAKDVYYAVETLVLFGD